MSHLGHRGLCSCQFISSLSAEDLGWGCDTLSSQAVAVIAFPGQILKFLQGHMKTRICCRSPLVEFDHCSLAPRVLALAGVYKLSSSLMLNAQRGSKGQRAGSHSPLTARISEILCTSPV